MLVTGVVAVVTMLFVVAPMGTAAGRVLDPASDPSSDCRFWVSPDGDDEGDGTSDAPWASIQHAIDSAPDAWCTILVEPGTYAGGIGIKRRFETMLTLSSIENYRAVLEHTSTVIDFDGARNVVVEGFEMRQSGPGSVGFVVNVDRRADNVWAENITLRNNILHDSYDDDLLKLHAGVEGALVQGNVFYNQGPSEQHMDVNSVMDVVIEDNIFFNDFARSGRSVPDSKHFIVIKDSGAADDGIEGSRWITVRRNVFMNWEGGNETFVRVGNDGKPYFEARNVDIESNLFLGNSANHAASPLGVSGAKDVSFVNNTVVGDLPSRAYGFVAVRKDENPANEALLFANNIWSDPTGTMDDFTSGTPEDNVDLILDTNLYWNGGETLPTGDVVTPLDDTHALVADPLVPGDHANARVPFWKGDQFLSGNATIREEFVRVIDAYASIPKQSAAVDAAQLSTAAATDIWGSPRGSLPDLGAWEVGADRTVTFPDFSDDNLSVHEADIAKLAQARITLGCNPPANDLFCPDDPVTRAQMASFLVRALDIDPTDADSFSDDDGSVHEADINAIGAAGITMGCDPPANDNFCPHDPVTRAQMASLLVRALDTEPAAGDPFSDDDGSVHEASIARIAASGITRGCNPPVNDLFCPEDPVTRGQMASFLVRALDL